MAFAFGKVILIGEHAVVYGVPAIACGIDRGVTASAVLLPGSTSLLKLDGEMISAGEETPLSRAFASLLWVLDSPPVLVRAESQLPSGCGLGGSAALGVAIARAVLCVNKHPDNDSRQTLIGAHAWETEFHGSPSGVDAATSAFGGIVRYIKKNGARQVPAACDLRLVVAIAGPSSSTKLMVERVADIRKNRPHLTETVFRSIEALSEVAADCLESGDQQTLGEVMDNNHYWLKQLQLSTPAIEEACIAAKKAGAFGAKVTGAGGGGAVVALVDQDPAPALSALNALGLKAFATCVRSGKPRLSSVCEFRKRSK